jgi:hypothetical protein
MNIHLKLRNQILALGLVGVLMAVMVGGIGLFNSSRLATTIDDSVSMGKPCVATRRPI